MEKFGMTFGGGPGRKELLETLESQKKQLTQYQSRFKDLVHAYKGLLKEKEALEASLEALSASRDSRPVLRDHGEGGDDATEPVAAGNGAQSDLAADTEVCPENRLDTLAGALTTVTQEKSRMEAGFRADRRQLKREADELRERLADADRRFQSETGDLRGQLAESRSRLLAECHERRQEESERLLQLQELQELLCRERQLRRDAELRLEADPRGAGGEEGEEGEERADSAAEEARAHAAELRVAVLEQRVTELSDLLGACEKARRLEQREAQTLREQVARRDAEKTMPPPEPLANDSHPDVALRDKLDKVKKLLLTAQKNNEAAESDDDPSGHLRDELRRLKEELEGYKRRAKATPQDVEDDGRFRRQLEELREKYVKLRLESDEAAASHREQLREEKRRAAALLQERRQEAEREAAARRDELQRLDAELRKQRQRTAALLDDKDHQLELLRVAAAPEAPSPSEEELSGAGGVCPWPAPLLYAEQLARKEAEAESLRRQKRLSEDDLRRARGHLADEARRRQEETLELRARLDETAREHKREGANVEYLKNVIYKFLTLPDAGGRRQTLDAILSILHFSPQEKHCVLRQQQGTPWWGVRKR
ncbi:GRIP and coiled-coil domain-containing protein 1 [Stigmatopora nigra]